MTDLHDTAQPPAEVRAWLEANQSARVVREPRTYEEWKPDSFFADLLRSELAGGDVAHESRARLARHRHELTVEARVNPNTTAGTGGEFAPPLWAVEKFATAVRAGRVLADLIPNMFLPAGFSSVHVPKINTGADAGIQPGQGAAPLSVDQVTADTSSPVVTVAGDLDVSLQLLEQTAPPGYDAIAYLDLHRAYNQSLEKQLMNGTGASGQMTGVTQVTGRNTDVDGSGGSTIAAYFPLVGRVCAAIGNARLLPVEYLLVAPRRWEWIASSLDTSNRPIASPGQVAMRSDLPGVGVGQTVMTYPLNLLGHPAYQSGAITAGASADVTIAIRATDMLLYESAEKFAVMQEPLAGTLQVRLRLHRYAAFPISRPAGICVLTAVPQPTNF